MVVWRGGCFICRVPDELFDRTRCPGLKVMGTAMRHTVRDGNESAEVRYYILSKYIGARRFAQAVRGPWGIRNRLHWQLAVTFQEEPCGVGKGHADAN